MEALAATIQPWHWLVMAVLMLIAETLGAGGFLIGIALAAFIQSIIAVSFDNLSWDFQLLIFGLNSIVFTIFYWRVFRRFNQKTDSPSINNRAVQFVGRRFVLEQGLENGQGRIKIGDTLWRVKASASFAAGTKIEVVDTEGMELIVEESD